MMHLAYPNVTDRTFRGCVRYAFSLQAPDSSYTLASPNTPNLATIRAVTLRLAPEWLDREGYKVPIYEKADARGTWQGASLDLAYLLAAIRCVRTLQLEALGGAGDIWCTGAIGALESGAPRLKTVDLATFEVKLAGFLDQPHDRLFLVPAANLHYELYQRCHAHDVQVLPLSTFQRALPEALVARRWATKTVALIDDVQLQLLVATLFEQPFPAAEPEAEEMLRRPYRFLAAFEGKDADLFCGREREIRQLQSLLPRARLLILHGASGTGKTSLLQAGLLPRLPPAQYTWVRVRVVDDEPTRAIKATMIDQLGLAPRLQDQPLVDFLHVATTAVGKSVVIIFDQFEEFFLRFPLTVRQGFHHDLGACVTAADLAVHMLIALREDYLARLAEFQDVIPTIFTHTMRLDRLTVPQAFSAVVEPARRLGLTVDEALIQEVLLPQLIDADQRIDPPLLQLVCDALYQQAQDTGRTILGREEYTALGDVSTVLGRSLEATLRQFGPDQPQARAVLKALVTTDGTKLAAFVEDLVSRLYLAGVSLRAEALELLFLRPLVQARLVRVEEVQGPMRYELTHEYLVQQIEQWRAPEKPRRGLRLKVGALLLLVALGLGSVFVGYQVIPRLIKGPGTSIDLGMPDSLLRGVAVSPDGTEVYVADEKRSEVLVLDRATLATRVRVSIGQPGTPETPQRIVPTPDGRQLYVTNPKEGTVIVLDRRPYQVRATIRTGKLPRWVTITPDGRKAYVSNEGPIPQGSISVIDTATFDVVTSILDVNCPEGSAVTQNGTRLYVASQCGAGEDPVFVIDTSTDKVIATIPGLAVGMTLAVTPDGRKMYVARGNYPWKDPTTGREGSPLSVLATTTIDQVRHTFLLETSVTALAMTRDGKYLLVGNGRKISIIDTTADQVVKELKLRSNPFDIAIAADNSVYVTLPEKNQVWLFGLSGLIDKTVPAAGGRATLGRIPSRFPSYMLGER